MVLSEFSQILHDKNSTIIGEFKSQLIFSSRTERNESEINIQITAQQENKIIISAERQELSCLVNEQNRRKSSS